MNPTLHQTGKRGSTAFKPSLRFDLEWIHYPADQKWVAHDPLSGDFYRFNEFEYAAAQLMDGTKSISDLLEKLKSQFGRISIDSVWVQTLVLRMQQALLLQPTKSSLTWFTKRYEKQKQQQIWQVLLSPLSIRIPLFDPGRLLDAFYVPARLLFSKPMGVAVALLAVLSVFLISRWTVNHGFPQLDPNQINIDRWFLLLVCYGLVKSLHEFGHMLACARFKVRSSEVGILLLCLMPCFYCDTTDAWRLSSKWQRALISAAGIYVELIIAIAAALVWLFLNDGTLNLICLNLMLVCSISTVVLNANPLLRYDGYYILSDLWGVPNLHDQSKAAFKNLFSRFVLMQRIGPIGLDANKFALASFAVASWMYRVFVMFAILWLVWTFLPPLGLQLAAVAVTASLAVGIVISQKRVVMNSIQSFQRMDRNSRYVAATIWSLILLVCIGVLFLPFPRYITARGYLDYEDKSPIYATYDAKIQFVATQKSQIAAGALVLSLESPTAELELTKINGDILQTESKSEQFKLRRTLDPETEFKIPQLEADLQQLRARQSVLAKEYAQLKYHAPYDGYLIDAFTRPSVELTDLLEPQNKPSVLDPENQNAWLRRSDLLGWFSPMKRPVVVALVPEHTLQGLTIGSSAKIRRDCDPFHEIEATVTRIAPDKIRKVPQALLGDQSLVSLPNANGIFEPETPHYEVTLTLIKPIEFPKYDELSSISIQLESMPIHRHFSEFIRRTLRPVTK